MNLALEYYFSKEIFHEDKIVDLLMILCKIYINNTFISLASLAIEE